jgi:hypothetical protein
MAIKLRQKPTFKFRVELAQPGTDERATLALVGKHKGQNELRDLVGKAGELEGKDAEFLPLFLEDWEGVQDEDGKPAKFTTENVAEFLDQWPGAGLVIFQEYCKQISAGRLKN